MIRLHSLTEMFEGLMLHSMFPQPKAFGDDGAGGGDDTATLLDDGEILASDEESYMREAMKLGEDDFSSDDNANDDSDDNADDGADDSAGDDTDDDASSDDDDAGEGPDDAPSNADDGDIYIDVQNNKEYVWKDGKWVDADAAPAADASDTDDATDDSSTDDAGDEDGDYIDDVIPGLKGADFAALSEDSQAAVATFFEEATKIKKDYTAIADAYKALAADPIAQQRLQLIRSGQNLQDYALPAINDKEIEAILDAADPTVAKKKIESMLRIHGETMANNARLQVERTARLTKMNEVGESLIIEAANMHPECKHKISSFANVDTEGHPDKETYTKFTEKVVEYCRQRGWRYDKVSEYEPNELYLLVAHKNRWPIVQNAEERDKTLVKEKVAAALQHFRRKRADDFARGMRQTGSSQDRFSDRRTVRKNGVDLIKLATSDDYHDKVLNMKHMDVKWIESVGELRREGEQIIARRNAKKKRKTG